MNNINQKMASGIVWMILARLLDRSIGIISTLILARLLVPGDFGLIAMATAVGGMLDLLGAFSFDLALIQNEKADRRHYDTVWTFNLIFGIVCALAMIALALPASHFYHEPRLASVMWVLSASYFIGAFGNIGVVNFRKNLQFQQEFQLIFAKRLATFTATIGTAYFLRSYWALLVGMTVGKMIGLWLSYKMNEYRPRFTLVAASELFSFSKWLLLNNLLGFLRHDGCTFIIGRIFGTTGLGIYTVSYEISNLPTTELVAPINRVTFPGFSKMVTPDAICESYMELLGMITLLIVPIGVGIAAVAEPLVLTALGEKWRDGIPLIAILALSGAMTATQTNNASVWLALGRPREVARVQIVYILVLFSSLYYFLTTYGIVGTGYAYVTAQTLDVVLEMRTTQRLLAFRWNAIMRVVWRPIVAALGMYLVVRGFDQFVAGWVPILRLFGGAMVGVLAYTAIALGLWMLSSRPNGAETFCLGKLKLI